MNDVPNDYRRRLGPFIERWLREGTPVAIFGTGPHTDFLFEQVPDLHRVRIVGYLNSDPKQAGRYYRGKRIHPPGWAEGRADVILCSSFVSEPVMAAAIEHLACKILMSHTPPNYSRSETAPDGRKDNLLLRPPAHSRLIDWPAPATNCDGRARRRSAASEELRERLAEMSGHPAALDAVIDRLAPDVGAHERDLARAIVRYAVPGSTVVQVGGDSLPLASLAVRCSGTGGSVCFINPSFAVGGLAAPGRRRGISRRAPRVVRPYTLSAIVARVETVLKRAKGQSVLVVEETPWGIDAVAALLPVIQSGSPAVVLRCDERRWLGGTRRVVLELLGCGYSLLALERSYSRVTRESVAGPPGGGIVHLAGVRAGRDGRSRPAGGRKVEQ